MFHRPLLAVLVLDCCLLTHASAGDKPSAKDIQAMRIMLEKQQKKEIRALGDKAIPALVELFKQKKHRPHILPILANMKTKLARTAIEKALAVEEDNDWIYWEARALGSLKDPASKPVLLATIKKMIERTKSLGEREPPPDEPSWLGVMLGGGSDGAFFAAIWALGRIEGKEFGKSMLDKDHLGDCKFSGSMDGKDVAACIQWWHEYKKEVFKAAGTIGNDPAG